MGKRIHFTEDERYVLAQLLQDELNNAPKNSWWAITYTGKTHLRRLLNKLALKEKKKEQPTKPPTTKSKEE